MSTSFFHLFFTYLISLSLCINPLLMTTGNSEQIVKTAECVLKLSAKYFVEKKALSGSIVIININSYASTTQRLLLQTIHGGIKYSVMVKDSFYPHANASHFPEKAKNYMLILEEKSELRRNILQLDKLPTWNPLAKAIVFYQLKDGEKGVEAAIDFINELWEYRLLKSIIFIYSPENGEVVSFTWSPYSETNCGGRCDPQSVYILDRCKDNFINQIEPQREIFPLDMKGCPLVAFAIISEPYVLSPTRKLSNTDFDDAYEFQRGGEISLVKIISQFTNMSLIIRMSDTPEGWGIVYPNGTATEAYGVLRNNSADLVIGNIEVTRTLRKFFDPTVSYTQDEMVWCVPRAGQAATWDNLIIIFQWSTWVCTLLSLILMGLIFHIFYYREQERKITKWPTNSILMTFSMLLGWGSTFEPKSLTFRILVFSWLYFSINLAVTYESFLRSFLLHPRFERQASSELDIIASGMPLGGREAYRSYFESNNASSYYLYRKYESISFAEGIQRVAFDRNFAVVSSRRQAAYLDQQFGKGDSLIYCFPESNNLYKYGVALLARKWFPILERFNSIIRSVSENGLIEKWNKELFVDINGEVPSTVIPLTNQHLLGAFMLIGLMYGTSAVVFVWELVYHYVLRRRLASKNIINVRSNRALPAQ